MDGAAGAGCYVGGVAVVTVQSVVLSECGGARSRRDVFVQAESAVASTGWIVIFDLDENGNGQMSRQGPG